jgi:hypothetical protein
MSGGSLGTFAPAAARTPLPDEFVAAEDVLRGALVAADGADGWDAGTRAGVLAWVAKQRNVLTVLEGRVLNAEREAGTWALKGDRDLAAFAGRISRQGRGAGSVAVGQAATLAAMPVVAGAVVDGPVTERHVQEIGRATASSPLLAAELVTAEGQARVVEMAGRLDGAEFGRRLKQMSAALDPASRQREHDRQRAGRYLHITHLPGGTLIKAQLDSVAGHKFGKAIDALVPRPGKDDERDRAQHQADALMAMVDRILADKRTTPDATAPVQVVVTFREDTWAALRTARGGSVSGTDGRENAAGAACGSEAAGGVSETTGVARDGDAVDAGRGGDDGPDGGAVGVGSTFGAAREPSPGSAADVVARLRGVAPVVDEDGRAWPASEIARALCDCTLTRAVVDAFGQVLDLGRGQRPFTRGQWLAVYASGQTTCAVAGCSMPLRYCELHHMRWWGRDGGRTDLANCAPVCSYHHHEIHRLDLRIARRPDGVYELHHPDGRVYGEAAPPGWVPPGDGPGGGECGDECGDDVSGDDVSGDDVSGDDVLSGGMLDGRPPGVPSGEVGLFEEQPELWSV